MLTLAVRPGPRISSSGRGSHQAPGSVYCDGAVTVLWEQEDRGINNRTANTRRNSIEKEGITWTASGERTSTLRQLEGRTAKV